jgi:hypothetical protein
MTKPKRYKRYSAEFKKEAIRRATEEGITDKAVLVPGSFDVGEMSYMCWAMMRFPAKGNLETKKSLHSNTSWLKLKKSETF